MGALNDRVSRPSRGSHQYQELTIKLIATEMLHHGPHYSVRLGADDDAPVALLLPGEVNVAELALTCAHILPCHQAPASLAWA